MNDSNEYLCLKLRDQQMEFTKHIFKEIYIYSNVHN